MKNKRGFTLIELLAVIVIISFLSIIAVPIVSKQIIASRQRAFVEDGRTIASAVKTNYFSDKYLQFEDDVTVENDKIIFSKKAIAAMLGSRLDKSSFNSEYRDISVTILKSTNSYKDYKFYICMIDNNGNGFNYTKLSDLSAENVIVSSNNGTCSELPKEKHKVDIVVDGGTVGNYNKMVSDSSDLIVDLIPNNPDLQATVSCPNTESAYVFNNKLYINRVFDNTTCSVIYDRINTVLFNDGTLIINELYKDRNTNISKYGQVMKEYTPYINGGYIFTKAEDQPWYNENNLVKKVEIGSDVSPTSTAYWFDGLFNMESVNLKKLDTSRVTSMIAMFRGKHERTYRGCGGNCEDYAITGKLKSLDLSNFDTSNVTKMTCMFEYQPALKTLDLTSFDTSKVTSMGYMFNLDNGLETIDLSSFDTSKVTFMMQMFYMGRDTNDQDGTYNYLYNGQRIPTSLLSTIYVSERWSVAGLDLSSPNSTNGMFCNAVSLPHYFKMPYTFRHDKYANYSDTGFLTYKAFTPGN